MINGRIEKPFTVRFIDAGAQVLLELTNTSEESFRGVEILSVFLKDEETPGGGPSRAHINFDAVRHIQPKAKAVLSHRTLIDGRRADPERDQLGRLKAVDGVAKPYVLDISWEGEDGKMGYQRIPVGH
jgi:hypothetical protein